MADEFVESVVGFASRLAKHRKSDTLEVKDVQLHLERNWNIRIPGFGSEDVRSVRRNLPTPSFQAKAAAVQNAHQVATQRRSARHQHNQTDKK